MTESGLHLIETTNRGLSMSDYDLGYAIRYLNKREMHEFALLIEKLQEECESLKVLLAESNARLESFEEDPEYQQWVEEISKHCHCCTVCFESPCGGVMAGGLCDDFCMCEDE